MCLLSFLLSSVFCCNCWTVFGTTKLFCFITLSNIFSSVVDVNDFEIISLILTSEVTQYLSSPIIFTQRSFNISGAGSSAIKKIPEVVFVCLRLYLVYLFSLFLIFISVLLRLVSFGVFFLCPSAQEISCCTFSFLCVPIFAFFLSDGPALVSQHLFCVLFEPLQFLLIIFSFFPFLYLFPQARYLDFIFSHTFSFFLGG